MTALPILQVSTAAAAPRRASYALRVSVLAQCQLACRYCMPGSVVPPTTKARWLSAAQHALLAPAFASVGVRKVRFTGGEPLLRTDLSEIVAAWRLAAPTVERALTTNGQMLVDALPRLVAAGLQRVTVHLDTLRQERMNAVMGGGTIARALAAVDAVRAHGLAIKLNVVVQTGVNDDEIVDFVAWSRGSGVQVRFIELMNTGSATDYTARTFLSGADIVARVAEVDGATAIPRAHGSDPASLWRTSDGVVFGLIASDTQPFCDRCDRLRLTADGHLRGCLYETGGHDLRSALDSGDAAQVSMAIAAGLSRKRSFHPSTQQQRQPFSMADVGG